MLLYLIRHAKAHKDSATGSDFDRELNPRGVEQAAWLGRALASHTNRPRLILTSPVTRALQTARAIEAAVGVPLQVAEELSTDHDAADYTLPIEQALAETGAAVAAVAHNPTLEQLAELLLRGTGQQPPEFRTGQAVLLEIDPNDQRPTRVREILRMDSDD